jgi:hypothetical protein
MKRSFYRHQELGTVELVGILFKGSRSECFGLQGTSDHVHCFKGNLHHLLELKEDHPHVQQMLQNRDSFMEQKAIWAESQPNL